MSDYQYRKGYVAGFRDGLIAAQRKTEYALAENMQDLPIDTMQISARAKNCLIRIGCRYISEVAKLSDQSIATMRGLGLKSATEIAQCLDEMGIHYSAWCRYL